MSNHQWARIMVALHKADPRYHLPNRIWLQP